MVYPPQTVVKLFKYIPADPNYNNALQFDTVDDQINYFAGASDVLTFTDFNYIDNSQAIRVRVNREKLIGFNYLAYQNKAFGNKWFYAFITETSYDSPNSTSIYFEIDRWATWQFDITYYPSFVERECVTDDTIGKNLIPETLEMGPVVETTNEFLPMPIEYAIVLTNKILLFEAPYQLERGAPSIYSGYYFSTYFYIFPVSVYQECMDAIVKAVTEDPSAEIISIYTTPDFKNIHSFSIPNAQIDGYKPRNNKLYTYPYVRAMVAVPGATKEYRYEDLDSLNCAISCGRTPSSNCVVKINSKLGTDYDNIMTFGDYPQLGWMNNAYQEWLATRAYSNVGGWVAKKTGGLNNWATAVSMFSESVGAGVDTFIGSGLSSKNKDKKMPLIQSGYSMIKEALNGANEAIGASILPDKAFGNAASGETMLATNTIGVYTACFSIKPEFAATIDDFFSMYGYRVNRVKNLEIHSRKNWNFIKTINANLGGNVPAGDLEIIKGMFNKGVTLWHNYNFDYKDLSNPIL